MRVSCSAVSLAVVMPARLRPGTAGSPGSWPAATTGRLSPTPTGRSSRRSTTPLARARARARTRLVRPGGGWREQTSACPPSPEQPCLCSERRCLQTVVFCRPMHPRHNRPFTKYMVWPCQGLRNALLKHWVGGMLEVGGWVNVTWRRGR